LRSQSGDQLRSGRGSPRALGCKTDTPAPLIVARP